MSNVERYSVKNEVIGNFYGGLPHLRARDKFDSLKANWTFVNVIRVSLIALKNTSPSTTTNDTTNELLMILMIPKVCFVNMIPRKIF